MELIDISLPISENTPVWEGDKHPEFNTITSIEKGDPYNSTSIRIGAHTGTHIDAPRHFLENGETLEKIPLSKLTGTAQVVEVDDAVMAINENILSSLKFEGRYPQNTL